MEFTKISKNGNRKGFFRFNKNSAFVQCFIMQLQRLKVIIIKLEQTPVSFVSIIVDIYYNIAIIYLLGKLFF